MLNISKSVITPFTPAQMYALVSDIENYKNYLYNYNHSLKSTKSKEKE